MSFHTRWESGQLLSRATTDLSSIRRFAGFGLLFLVLNILQVTVVTGVLLQHVLAARAGRRGHGAPIDLAVDAVREGLRRGLAPGPGRAGRPGDPRRGGRGRHPGDQVVRPGRARLAASTKRPPASCTRTLMDKVRLSARFWTFLEVIPNLAVVVVLLLGAIGVGKGLLTPGELVAFITLMLSLVWPVASLGVILAMAQEAMTVERPDPRDLRHRARHRVRRPGHRAAARAPAVRGASTSRSPAPTSRCCAASTSRSGRARPSPLVGATGSGKTVLTALVPRLYDVTGGRVTIDGVDVRELDLGHLRSLVATAFEDPTLFSMSARENLTLGRPRRRQRRRDRAGARHRPGRLRPRAAVGARHPDRRAGAGALRRPAAAARAGPRRAGQAQDPGPRRHPLRARRAHREAGRGGAAAGCCPPRPG